MSAMCRRCLGCCIVLTGLCLGMGCEMLAKETAADRYAGRLPPQSDVLE